MTADLRVAVNLLWCVPGDVGGSEEYLVRQLLGVRESSPEIDLTLFVVPGFREAHPDLCSDIRTVVATTDGRSRSRRVVAEHSWLARRSRGFDVVHHGGGTVPLIGARPIVLTIHDLQYLSHPEYHSALKLRYLRSTVPRSVRRAAVVATPSQWVRSTVIDELGASGDRVAVVPHGVEPELGAAAPDARTLRQRYGLGEGPVLVFPAITHPHKGHQFLLDVMAASWTDPDLRLVLLGGRGRADPAVAASIDRLGLSHRVIRPGRVPDADRDGLIAIADALVFPSEYEGFGAPLVEAMALGTPVIAVDQPAVAEVVGGAGIVIPRTIAAWTGSLDEVSARRPELVRLGRARAKQFTTARSGAALAGAYRAAVRSTTSDSGANR